MNSYYKKITTNNILGSQSNVIHEYAINISGMNISLKYKVHSFKSLQKIVNIQQMKDLMRN